MSRSIIPHYVLPDIFCRLPVEALLRFRSLSKTCCSLIDSPEFVKLHLDQSIKTRSVSTIFIIKPNVRDSVYAVELDSSDMCPVKLKKMKFIPGEYHEIGSCNGLLAMNISEKFILWNPWTRKSQILPFSTESCRQTRYGFCYDAVSGDYKVIMINPQGFEKHCKVFIYSLKTNYSRMFVDLNLSYIFNEYDTWGIFLGGSLHWIYGHKENMKILAFDIGKYKFNCLIMPEDMGRNDHSLLSLVELGGCLGISCSYKRICLEIWIMKEYGVGESWAKMLSCSFTELGKCFHPWKPLCYSRSGDKVILTDHDGEFVWYDVEQEKIVKRVAVFKSSPCESYHKVSNICVGSVVPLGDNVENTRTG